MFKIGMLNQVNNEQVNIDFVTQREFSYKNGKKDKDESFKSLSFNIDADDYSFSFDLNCRLEKLLELPMNETIDFNKYIFGGETWLSVKDLNGIVPKMDIKITRYLKNKFIIYLTFFTEYSDDDNSYAGMIEFTFNLDDYLEN